jgi:hypothetical protein
MKRTHITRSVVGCLLAIAVLCPANRADADDFSKSGRTAFQFLKIGIGARQTAAGEATIASVRDVNSVFWNPAGLAGVRSVEAAFSYTRWFADLKYSSGAVGVRLGDVGVVGLSFASLGYGEIPEALVLPGSSDTRTGNTFTGHDMLFGLTYSRNFTDQLALGVSAKYVEEKLFRYTVNIVAFDVGTNYAIGFKGTRLAMSFQNFGSSVKFIEREEGEDIPLVFRIGVSTNVSDGEDGFLNLGQQHRLVLSSEIFHTNDFGDRLHVGGEYTFDDFLAVRGGYRFNYDEGNLSVGFGLHQSVSGMDLRIDYSFVKYEFLESPHRFTVTMAF